MTRPARRDNTTLACSLRTQQCAHTHPTRPNTHPFHTHPHQLRTGGSTHTSIKPDETHASSSTFSSRHWKYLRLQQRPSTHTTLRSPHTVVTTLRCRVSVAP